MEIFNFKIPMELIDAIAIIIIAFIANLMFNMVIGKIIKFDGKKSKYNQKRIKTVLLLVKRFVKYTIVFITLISLLSVFHINTTTIVTSVGALSVIIGLVFQDLLKDILVGISIIIEDNFSIGDFVEINGFKGEVISFSLKTTRIKSLTNEVKIISNRQISELINYSINKSLVFIKINVSYEEDIIKTEKVLKDVCKDISKKYDFIDEVYLLDGVEELSDSSVVYKLSTLVPIKDIYIVKRTILKEVKLIFDKNNIKIPYPQVEVHNGK